MGRAMKNLRKLTVITAVAVLATGCATTEPKPGMMQVIERDDGSKFVVITGSRIPRPADRAEGRTPGTVYPLYVMEREELWNTGATTVGGALEHLPFVDIHR